MGQAALAELTQLFYVSAALVVLAELRRTSFLSNFLTRASNSSGN
jgi:hypothetical protein